MSDSKKIIVAEYVNAIKSANTEDAKKETFIYYMTRLFPEEKSIISQFTGGAEHAIYNIHAAGRKSERGSADTQYGNVIIEFVNNLERTGKHAEYQLK